MTRFFFAPALLALSACVSSDEPGFAAPLYPFVGTWDCEVAVLTFSASTYNNGSEDLPIENVLQRDANAFVLGFADGYSIALDMDGADRMQWLSGETGDAFQCKRL